MQAMMNNMDQPMQVEGAGQSPFFKLDNRALKDRIDSDIALKRILLSLVGTNEQSFRDGLLYDSTIVSLHDLWERLDYVHEGVLRQHDFQSARGALHPIWVDILNACDFDANGNITPPEFVAGFVMAALDKEISVSMPVLATERITGLRIMTGVVAWLNEQILQEIAVVKLKMGWA